MIDTNKFNAEVAELEKLLRAKLGVRGKSLAQRLARAGRRLPRRLQAAGQVIVQAQVSSAHPKLARLSDATKVNTAIADIKTHLETIDPADRRKGVVLGVLGGMVFNLVILVLMVLALMRWQGLI